MMKISQTGITLIKYFEGCRLKAYKDSAGIWTVGHGAIILKSGKRVKEGDEITQIEAEHLLAWQIDLKQIAVNAMLAKAKVSQNQFDALVSFAYNLGIGALAGSTLLKLVKVNPNDPAIGNEFLRWNKARVNGKLKVVAGLSNRRLKEAALYFL